MVWRMQRIKILMQRVIAVRVRYFGHSVSFALEVSFNALYASHLAPMTCSASLSILTTNSFA